MENPGITPTREAHSLDEKSQIDTTDIPANSAADATENDVGKVASNVAAAMNENMNDNITSIESTNETGGATKEEADNTGATKLKSEGTGNAEENSPEEIKSPAPLKKDDHANLLEDHSAVQSENGIPSSPSEPATIIDNNGIKPELTSSKEDGAAMNKKIKQCVAPIVSKNQHDKKRDSKSPEPVVKEEDTISMEVDSSETKEREPSLEDSLKTPAETSNAHLSTTTTYSTRGRSTEAAAVEEKPERIHIRDTFEESPRPKDPPTGVSFLVDAMTEEERRTRTRFLPDVDGMHMLRKNEIKDDVALASSLPCIVSPSGLLQTRIGRLGNMSGRSTDSMDIDGDEVTLATNDEITTTIELPSSTLTLPSDAFVAPKGVVVEDADNNIEVKDFEPAAQSPSIVESVMSFNPPRPPESVGGKKKHRMIRWERRPEDIEVDMKNYRRTVQRTRQELQKSEIEYERLEMIDAHLRHHFLNHSELLDQEYNTLQDQLDVEVENLMKESDLVGSRTRSRNLTKVDVVMRDVLTMLTRNEQKDVSMKGVSTDESVSTELSPGVGGLNSQAFIDWQRSTKIESMSPCVSWIEPGQQVITLYGEGIVIAIIPPESPPTNDNVRNLTADNGNKSKLKNNSKQRNHVNEEKLNHINDKNKYDSLLPLRVKVRLRYGIGVFLASSIVKIESPARFTDAKLAKRWKGMIDSALEVGPCIDLQGVIPNIEKTSGEIPSHHEKETKEVSSTDNATSTTKKLNNDFLTVGASLIPTKFGRGNFLHNMKIRDIEETLQNVLYGGHGVLGRKSNPGVSNDVRKWEDDEQEFLNLRASVLQLKNALYRQRRIRVLNERTTISMNDRYLRAEELVSEMRSDLKSLKRRLGDELKELGITDEMANQILFQFYQGHQEEDKGDASTPKRLRRASSMIGEMLTDIDVGNDRREGDPRDSMDDQGTDDLSGDDLEARRPAKKIRSGVLGE